MTPRGMWLLIGFAISFLIGIVLIGIFCSPWLAFEVVVGWCGVGFVLTGPRFGKTSGVRKLSPWPQQRSVDDDSQEGAPRSAVSTLRERGHRSGGEAMNLRTAVQIERRAAEIAAGMISGTGEIEWAELAGWCRYGDNFERGTYPKSADWQAGWLAAAIYSHEIWDQPCGHKRW